MIEKIYNELQGLWGQGKVADYIPALAKVDPRQFGIALATLEGKTYRAGDADVCFSIQSISKVFTLAMVTRHLGDEVWQCVGREPSGNPFNSLVQLEYEHGIPRNPFINAGAIAVASCIKGADADEKFERFLTFTRKLCDNDEIALNQAVYESERDTGDRNRALAYYLKASGILEGDVEECLDFYFRMCSVNVTAHDIAYMSLVLANHGIDPRDGEELIEPQNAKAIRALMLTCGMYDGSGEFAMTVGFPAKSGVGGGMIAGFHEKPSDERAIENWKKVCRIAALPILLCLALIDASVCCFVLRHDLAGGLLMGAAVAEAVALVAIFNKSKKISLLIKMSKDEFWRVSK